MASPFTNSAPDNSNNVSGIDNISKILNKKVDLITNSNIRYEGVLIQIKTQDQRLLLKDVKSFGTEGRNGGINEVPTPPADDPHNLYAFVEFQIPMIKELYLAKILGPVHADPAIVSVKLSDIPRPAKNEISPKEEDVREELVRAPVSENQNDFFDQKEEELEDAPVRGGFRGGYSRGTRRYGGGGYQRGGFTENRGYSDNRGYGENRGYRNNRGFGRGTRGHNQHGKFEKNPNYNLQEKLKDDFF
jgi:protein LSM14